MSGQVEGGVVRGNEKAEERENGNSLARGQVVMRTDLSCEHKLGLTSILSAIFQDMPGRLPIHIT